MQLEINEVNVREASQDDLKTLLAFEQELINTERPFDPTLKAETTYYDLNAMLESDQVNLFVAEWNNEVIGCGYARIESSQPFRKYAQHAYLGFMYVLPEYRGKGVNWKIIGVLKQWVRKKGLTEMRLEVYHENLPAIRAYEKFGFKKISIEMRYPV
jgi:ribosomal protein S18 acetylase RimI-like enzyme